MLHTELPIYKKGVELVSLSFHVQTQMRREFKRSLLEIQHATTVLLRNIERMAS